MEISWVQAFILGTVQGVTEFLPISSSGHLALFERALGLQGIPLTFDILTHFGTFLAVIVYFWKDIRSASVKLWTHIFLANIPIIFFGLLIKPYVVIMKDSRLGLAMAFLITAFFLFITDAILWKRYHSNSLIGKILDSVQAWVQKHQKMEPEFLSLLMIGVFQALAILPGVSRSGSTLTGGAIAGLDRETAFKFAFIIGLPAVFGAVALDLVSTWQNNLWSSLDIPATLFATIVASVVGLLSLRLLKYVITQSRLRYFAFYCIIVSIVSLLLV